MVRASTASVIVMQLLRNISLCSNTLVHLIISSVSQRTRHVCPIADRGTYLTMRPFVSPLHIDDHYQDDRQPKRSEHAHQRSFTVGPVHKSSRKPLKNGCRTFPSADLARYSISARSCGSTQWALCAIFFE
jgi:hypothetical protein